MKLRDLAKGNNELRLRVKRNLCSCESAVGERRRERYAKSHTLRNDIFGESPYIYHCGDVSGEVPPVPIPNTEVKLTCAENT